jgi:hypothetical protein
MKNVLVVVFNSVLWTVIVLLGFGIVDWLALPDWAQGAAMIPALIFMWWRIPLPNHYLYFLTVSIMILSVIRHVVLNVYGVPYEKWNSYSDFVIVVPVFLGAIVGFAFRVARRGAST